LKICLNVTSLDNSVFTARLAMHSHQGSVLQTLHIALPLPPKYICSSSYHQARVNLLSTFRIETGNAAWESFEQRLELPSAKIDEEPYLLIVVRPLSLVQLYLRKHD